jgi:hypothetical protein
MKKHPNVDLASPAGDTPAFMYKLQTNHVKHQFSQSNCDLFKAESQNESLIVN